MTKGCQCLQCGNRAGFTIKQPVGVSGLKVEVYCSNCRAGEMRTYYRGELITAEPLLPGVLI